jgi:two-component system response regulator FixJ
MVANGREEVNPGRMIAIVDDDAAICDSARILLEAYGLQVQTYQSATEFLRGDPDIDCLIIDHLMPGLNGLDFMSELRKRGSQVPTIMITASIDPTIERRAAKLGIRQVLRKPLSTRALVGAIEEELE